VSETDCHCGKVLVWDLWDEEWYHPDTVDAICSDGRGPYPKDFDD
jgi:hypothetical protein